MVLWEDESPSLEQLRVADNDQVLIEVRNKDQTWPEEMSTIANLSRAQAAKHRLGMYCSAEQQLVGRILRVRAAGDISIACGRQVILNTKQQAISKQKAASNAVCVRNTVGHTPAC